MTHGSQLGRTLRDQGIDGLALELREELVEAFSVDFGVDGTEQFGDVGSGGVGVTTGLEEEVGSDITHLEVGILRSDYTLKEYHKRQSTHFCLVFDG